MKNKDNLINGLMRLGDAAYQIADALRDESPPKHYSTEEVRAILAEKSKDGHKAETRALIKKHGADCLSEITDQKVLDAIAAEAEVLGDA